MNGDLLTPAESTEALPGWRRILTRMHLTVRAPDFATALAFVDRVGQAAEAQGHHPDIDLRYGVVHVALSSHDVGGVSARDVRLGQSIDDIVVELGLVPEVSALARVEIAVDALDIPAIKPFWIAAMGFGAADDEELVDPLGLAPTVWFQQMDAPREQRNRIHFDVCVPHDEAEGRVRRVLDAGGVLVSDERAPSFWILADAEGNEVCICTWQSGPESGPND
ncbi:MULTISPECIES: 4a-hydroxytetrahydrobiopterin dehydratase [unclassified Janibacter]|uniref:4a-hydroxytetrahydrobiopterin dehydratase n=1 Tax=unclassified Janibacter TaxID=2649294 RepID=UPI003CFE6623